MKKFLIVLMVIFGLNLSLNAQDGGLLKSNNEPKTEYNYGLFKNHTPKNNQTIENNEESNNDVTPIGGGIVTLITFGAAYAALKNRKKN